LVLDPQTGGAIASLAFGEVELLRPVVDARLAAQCGRAVAAYPLIPYANRIAWGRFSFGGQSFQLDRNFGDHPHTIHGNAWMHPWTVLESAGRAARLGFDHAPPDGASAREFPFAYRAEQLFTVEESGLAIRLSVQNRDTRPWPAGLGLHPYIARTPRATLRFEADTIWTTEATGLPTEQRAVEGDTEFDRGRPVASAAIDNCFAGWSGTARIAWPEHDLALRIDAAPPLDHLQLYTPAGRDFFGLEPVSNMPDAINRLDDAAGQGLQVLAPGQSLAATIRLSIEPVACVPTDGHTAGAHDVG
jgi:aldose 1-epimerase